MSVQMVVATFVCHSLMKPVCVRTGAAVARNWLKIEPDREP